MKSGTRAVGIAESYRDEQSTLAAVVVRADRAVESISYGECTVGGTDATESVVDLLESLDRPDARYVFVAGVALAWYNVLDLEAVHEADGRPVVAASFEESDGLEAPIREAFDGDERDRRLRAYRALPDRRGVRVDVGNGDDGDHDDDGDDGADQVFVRSVGVGREHADEVVRGFTFDGGRPEPLRVAREAARAGDRLRREGD